MDLEALLQREGATSFSFPDTEKGALESAFAHPPDIISSYVELLEGTGPSAVAPILAELGPIPLLFITATTAARSPCEPPGRVFGKPVCGPKGVSPDSDDGWITTERRLHHGLRPEADSRQSPTVRRSTLDCEAPKADRLFVERSGSRSRLTLIGKAQAVTPFVRA